MRVRMTAKSSGAAPRKTRLPPMRSSTGSVRGAVIAKWQCIICHMAEGRPTVEWLFRLAQEPRRLAFRYLVYNPLFIAKVALQLT